MSDRPDIEPDHVEPANGDTKPAGQAAILPEETKRAAEAHLAQLAQSQRARVAEGEIVRMPRLRHVGRRLRLERVRLGLAVERIRRAARSPRHALGRRRAWWRLLAKQKAVDARVISLLAVIGLVVVLNVTIVVKRNNLLWGVATAAFTGSFLGLLALLWTDFFRSPFVAWRMRRRILKQPTLILPTTVGSTKSELIPREDPLETIPRSDLYDEVIPSILSKGRRDVHVVVGEPGSGKTTALVGLAGLLARIGIVPVLVSLRGEAKVDLVTKTRETFERQIDAYLRSASERDTLWRWLYRRKRIAVLTDDIDQIGADGEKGFVLRRTLDSLATEDLPVVVTARPAGIPAGVAASAIDLGELREDEVVEHLSRAYRQDPSTRPGAETSTPMLRHWVRQGRLTEAPFYLELLALLAASGTCPELPPAGPATSDRNGSGSQRRKPDGSYEWNPLTVRFMLLERFYDGVADGGVRRWLGIERRERNSSLRALEGAALSMLAVTGLTARSNATEEKDPNLRERLEDFIDTDDRADLGGGRAVRESVSAHEVVDTGERMRILDRDDEGHLQFRHRIMQAYLASRRLVEEERTRFQRQPPRLYGPQPEGNEDLDWIATLLDRHHPEKLTAHMALTFAALRACDDESRASRDGRRADLAAGSSTAGTDGPPPKVSAEILKSLVHDAEERLQRTDEEDPETDVEGGATDTTRPSESSSATSVGYTNLDPRKGRDPEQRADPDDALIKLTTAADIARAIGCPPGNWAGERERRARRDPTKPRTDPATQARIVVLAQNADGATRWTKLGAIRAIAALDTSKRWQSIWEFTRDPDYAVRRAASAALEGSANDAYAALKEDIERLILKAAARSALSLGLASPARGSKRGTDKGGGLPRPAGGDAGDEEDLEVWNEQQHILPLRALGWVLPAIVSGLREDPNAESPPAGSTAGGNGTERSDGDGTEAGTADRAAGNGAGEAPATSHATYVRSARRALERLVTLAFEGGHHDLEASVAQGFKGDAMRHAEAGGGPGLVASNRRLVADICLDNAEFWYSRMLLHQALGLYAIVGANRDETLDTYARLLHPDRERHPFAYRAGRLARKAVERRRVGSRRWNALIWNDEGEVVSRRPAALHDTAAQLVADITVLLNLNEMSGEDRQAQFGYLRELPRCLSISRDRGEILGHGCHPTCGFGLCPYEQPPPDEPNAHRGVSRAFCRLQRQIARNRKPPWHRNISKRRLEDFWREMERRART